jgi:hypothetical protein
MSTVERLTFSLREEGRGVHALLWDDLGDLYRVLLVVHASLGDLAIRPFLVSGEATRLKELKDMIEGELASRIEQERPEVTDDDSGPPAHALWAMFLQQAVGEHVGLRLNGWRRPLSEPMGTLLVVRNADFDAFQRSSPDLASFIGPRIYDASRLLMLCSRETLRNLEKSLPDPFEGILRHLPGTLPSAGELADWSPLCSSDEG